MSRKLIGVAIGSVVLAFTVPAAALAVPAQLSVTNLAQPGLESEVPQPPALVSARGSCATPYSAQEANTGMSPCAPGSWPGPEGDWRPRVGVAGRDQLELAFDDPAEEVRYSSTSNFPRGLVNPAGQPHPNVDIITARGAQPTSDARVWTVPLPRFDNPPAGTPLTFSVVARAGTSWRNFAFLIQGPRWNDDQTRCGVFYNPDSFDRRLCIYNIMPGRRPPPADRQPPALTLRVTRRQRVRRARSAILYARCDEACWVNASGRLRVGRRSLRLRAASGAAPAGKPVALRVRLTSVATRVLRRAVGDRRRANILLTIGARDATGNTSGPTRRTIVAR